MALRRVDRSNAAAEAPVAQAGAWAEAYPSLVEYLTSVRWADGKAREVATLLMVAEGGAWKVCLHDRANGRSVWVSGQSPYEALEVLDGQLETDTAVWRPTKPYPGRK